ncbi:MAG: pyruvate, phosphate dikinase [candidate division SR1 bacterium CG_4_9_14_3_um_filter_40_9]|nr:MAG: pyruvate, phosphate dikinase [candidate division SR1 bacterium CG_4_9_14_3_um_filter_40_9]
MFGEAGTSPIRGSKDLGKDILGGKGKNLAEMVKLGLPIPMGFTITTETCDIYYKNNKVYPQQVIDEIEKELSRLEKIMGKKLGDAEDPLLVSVRSGAADSMPGMMDTVLNLGLNDQAVEGLIKKTNNPRFVRDSYRRFLQMFGNVVMEVPHHDFEEALQKIKNAKNVKLDTELGVEDLKEVVKSYKAVIQKATGKMFPNDGREQLKMAIDAVFNSWNNDRAIVYRKLNDIRGLLGTAVNIQSMVFGNMGDTSGTGVCFTRNPSTGENKFYGEFLMNAQGEDVVAGIRTPLEIAELDKVMPDCYKELVKIYQNLEKHYKDMQDMEFTIQEGKLYILQTRNGKRTAAAAVKMAVDMVAEGLIDEKTGVLRVKPEQLDALLHKQINPTAKKTAELITKGLPASPGAAVGQIVFTAQAAHDQHEEGKKVVLVRTETSPEDIVGMVASQGILTARGGMTSHAAVVARGMGKCCVAGASEIAVDEHTKTLTIKGKTYKEGDIITLDGSTGEVFAGLLETMDPELSGDFATLMTRADKYRTLGIRTNADTQHDSEVARKFGAEGIGLCRTEHMFFAEDRIKAVREMILSEDVNGRKKALDKLLPFQKSDFIGIFTAMEGLPVTIRFLDPPLHEFLPQEEKDIVELARDMNVDLDALKKKIADLHEFNPMLGHRGCRLVITYPEIAEMQTKAIILAAIELKKQNKVVLPEIMIPLVGFKSELDFNLDIVHKVAKETMDAEGVQVEYKVGTMIEVPRGAITADKIAQTAEFFSFGTNDLTQMSLGFSRDDAGKFIKEYVVKNIFEKDPFQTLDQDGVGQLIKLAIGKGRKTRPNIKLGICGEHGGDPASIEFCHKEGLNYVSCSPFRVPIARLAAAHAALKNS